MALPTKSKPTAPAPVSDPAPAPATRPDTTALSAKQLARMVLAREIKPRVSEVRRLAEAVAGKPKKPKKDKAAGKSADKPGKAERKLAKIPGQKRNSGKGKKKA